MRRNDAGKKKGRTLFFRWIQHRFGYSRACPHVLSGDEIPHPKLPLDTSWKTILLSRISDHAPPENHKPTTSISSLPDDLLIETLSLLSPQCLPRLPQVDPRPRFSLLLCFFFFFLVLLPISLSTHCHPNDKKALLRIKKALNNPYLLASWDPSTDCCDWYCVECHLQSNRIVELTIFNGELSAQIPPSIADLPYLRTLILRKLSNLTGEIPPFIAKLRNLRMIRLSWTNLSGSIPQSLSTLQNLTYLELSFNNLSGEIPASLAKLTNLDVLHLDRNRLTGQIPASCQIPASFGHFSCSVLDLYLSHNQLEGPIPASLSNLDFLVLDLSRNKLVGDASMLFQNPARSTLWIEVSRNLLEFDISGAQFHWLI